MDIFSWAVRAIGIISFTLTAVGYVIAIISYMADRSDRKVLQTNAVIDASAVVAAPVAARPRRLGPMALIIATISLATLAVDGTIFVLHPPTSTITPAPTAYVSSYAYDFEDGVDGWTVSEGSLRPIKLDTTTSPVFAGHHALRITGQFVGDASPIFATLQGDKDSYRHLEPTVYFSTKQPNGFNQPEPYDLSQHKQVSCYLYIPRAMTTIGGHETFVRLFVKDTHFYNSYSTYINIDASNVDTWFQISLIVGANADTNFDPTKVHALGVRIEAPSGSDLNYSGPMYIDACSIGK